MTNPASNPGEWVWITHNELGDSPNPVLRSALHHWQRNGWTETEPPREPDITAASEATGEGADTTDATGLEVTATASGVREEKPKATRPATAATPAATTE